jgi:ubiquinone/menaquinone biosynthesis C-methylase UbiE
MTLTASSGQETNSISKKMPSVQRQLTKNYSGLARFYDILLGNGFANRASENFDHLRRYYGLRPDSAADVACGTGTFILYLSSLGIRRIYGVDCSAEMLRIALDKNKANEACFLLQDFHSLCLPEPVDLITCNFDSLNYMLTEKDLLLALRRFHANLAPRGVLYFDIISFHQPWNARRPFQERRTWAGGEFWRRMHLDPRNGRQISLICMRLGNRIYLEEHHQRAYPIEVMVALLKQAGLNLVESRDFYTRQPVNRQTRRIIFVAQKV